MSWSRFQSTKSYINYIANMRIISTGKVYLMEYWNRNIETQCMTTRNYKSYWTEAESTWTSANKYKVVINEGPRKSTKRKFWVMRRIYIGIVGFAMLTYYFYDKCTLVKNNLIMNLCIKYNPILSQYIQCICVHNHIHDSKNRFFHINIDLPFMT